MKSPGFGYAWLWPVLLAPTIGSFLGVLIQRLPQGRSVAFGRSACETCHRILSAPDLVPVLSFLWLRGRCRGCGSHISKSHLAIELVALLVAVWAAAAVQYPALIWADCMLGWTLLALCWIDIRHFLLPDVLTLPLLLAGLAISFWITPSEIYNAAAGAAIGYLSLASVEIAYRALRHREGLGRGDAKLMAAAGAWVGWQHLPQVIVGAAIAGIFTALISYARRKDRTDRLGDTVIPFGPCIAIALWLVRLYGSDTMV